MNKYMTKLVFTIALTTFAGSCATVSLTTAGNKIRILEPDEVSSCRELGRANTTVTATALGVPRPPETVAKELETIARNSAANMKGDTIVPLTIIDDGSQTFMVYKCVNPDG